jgi:hypothetical protein
VGDETTDAWSLPTQASPYDYDEPTTIMRLGDLT